MIKGPKAIIASAIANALGKYFSVDANTIESNLLKDAKVVLRHVKLKEKVTCIPVNSAGKSTNITFTGCVEEVVFTWAWSVGDGLLMKDAVLTILGATFQAKFEHKERNVDEDSAAPAADDDNEKVLRESFVNPHTIDAASARKTKEQKGGLGGVVARQVKMAIDMLTFKMVDFELRVVLPPLQQEDVGVSSTNACNKVFVVSVDKIEILSFGRDGQDDAVVDISSKLIRKINLNSCCGIFPEGKEGSEVIISQDNVPSKLKQKINLNSLVCGIFLEGKEGNEVITSYPLVDSFSYSANVTMRGERLGGFLTGMDVLGVSQPPDICPDLVPLTGSGLSVHMGKIQIDSLMQLSIMILAPPDGTNSFDEKSKEPLSKKSASESNANASVTNEPSSFSFPLSSASLLLFEETRFVASCINMRYKADGTICILETAKMEYESDAHGQGSASQVVITMGPDMKMTIGCIESLYIPDSFLLSNPIQCSELSYEGNTLRLRLDAMDIVTHSKKPPKAAEINSVLSVPNLPCNIDLCIRKGMQIKKSEDGSLTKVGRFHLYALKEERCTKMAVQFDSFRNHLFSANTVSFCGSLPLDQVDTINDFIFDAEDVTIMSGHSTDEWAKAFRMVKQKVKQKLKKKSVIKLPFASIAGLKVVIGSEALHKVGMVKGTSLMIKPFKGKADTNSKDLKHYFIKACLSCAPHFFISNAGSKVVDSTTGLLATCAGSGLGLQSAFGAGAGDAAIMAVDAIKGAVDTGKISRSVIEGAGRKHGDFMRGLVRASGEAARDGVAKRGKQGYGNLIDWTVGATSNTADYVVENKNRLGAACRSRSRKIPSRDGTRRSSGCNYGQRLQQRMRSEP